MTEIDQYPEGLPPALAAICELLQREIRKSLPRAASKIWHAIPVWFVDENPVVGYKAASKHMTVLFWNGRSFGDSALVPVGKFKAAQIRYSDVAEIDLDRLRGWLKKCGKDVWDFRGHIKTQVALRKRRAS